MDFGLGADGFSLNKASKTPFFSCFPVLYGFVHCYSIWSLVDSLNVKNAPTLFRLSRRDTWSPRSEQAVMSVPRKGTLVGLSLATLGLTLLIVCAIPVTGIEKVIDTSFVVAPNTEYGPPNAGTSYHTRVLGKSVLRGDVLTEGGGVNLTVHGYNTQNLVGIYVEGQYSFVVDPADDLYLFTFSNLGHNQSLVQFKLEEIWTRPMAFGSPPLFILGLVALCLLVAGVAILIVTYPRLSLYISTKK